MATRSSIQKGVDAILGKTTVVTDTSTTTSNNPNNAPEKQTSDKTVEDMKMTGRADVSKFKVSIGDYLKDKGELSKAGAILEDIAKDEKTKLNILILIALSRWQTRDGTTIAIKKKHNPGCITGMGENEKLADLKSGYETMVKQLTSKLTENDGEWLSSTRLWYVTKLMTKDDAAGLEADDVKQMGAEEDKEGTSKSGGLSGSDTYDLPTQGPSITEQVSRLKPGWSSALPIIGGILKQNNLADGAQISSAARTPDRNASKDVNGANNSYHLDTGSGGDAVDIVLPDGTTQAQSDHIVEVFKNTKAFAEVLYHDAGSGLHLHLGGYGGAISGVSIKLEKQQMFWYDKLRTYVNDVYDKLLGEKPPWEKRILKKKDQQAKGRSSDKGVKTVSKVPHGKHGEDDPDSVLVVLPRNETFSEPVYPDLLTVADNVPQYIKTLSRVVKPPQDIDVFDLVTNPGKVADLYQEGIAKAVVIVKGKITGTTDSGEETPPQPVSSSGIIDESKIPKDKKVEVETKTTDNKSADTNEKSTVDNAVNQEAPSTPYEDGKPVSSGKADSALNIVNDLTNNQLSGIIGNMSDKLSRQIVYDPKKHKNSFKSPAKGKPANNNDAFPIDLKIEELEVHFPHAYIHEIKACPQAVSTATPLLEHAQATEKRLVKLENNMATLLRYFGALGTRLAINCVYWGGTSQYQKYRAIRCMKDNRLEDGQIVQLDQCLTCTRFEPIIGQLAIKKLIVRPS